MPNTLATLALTAVAAAALIGPAQAQSGDTSGAMSAEMQSKTSARAASVRKVTPVRRSAKQPPSTDMNTNGTGPSAAPTGPYTTTDGSSGSSDITGATGATITQPAAPAPPGVAPPGGAPDTGGGEAPNVDGGPH